jgi:protein phosphatase 1L
MEDRTKVADLTQHAAFAACERAGFFAVFDGHAGAEVAEHLSTHLLAYFLSEGAVRSDPLAALKHAVLRCEADVLKLGCGAGSTALVAVVVEDDLYVANVGDSRAIIHRRIAPKTEQLTRDHKPSEPHEKARLERAGAEVSHDGYLCGEPRCRPMADG